MFLSVMCRRMCWEVMVIRWCRSPVCVRWLVYRLTSCFLLNALNRLCSVRAMVELRLKLLGTGSAYFAPSVSVLQMVDSILLDKKMIMPCTVYLQGEYGINNLFIGVPAKLGAKGLEQ